jgi:cation transport ATPase
MLTGESIPVSKGIGDLLYCASINGSSSSFLMKVTKLPHESLIQDICKLVEAAQSKKAPIQGL